MYDTKACDSADSKFYGNHASGWVGGSIMIMNGTGEGQYRRIIYAGISTNPNVSTNRTWIIDKPFDVLPSVGDKYGSFIQIYPFRGQSIWYNNEFKDCGTWQTYGTSTEVILANNEWRRASKITFEGQWRGWTPASTPTESPSNKQLARKLGNLKGPTGVGINPNIR